MTNRWAGPGNKARLDQVMSASHTRHSLQCVMDAGWRLGDTCNFAGTTYKPPGGEHVPPAVGSSVSTLPKYPRV